LDKTPPLSKPGPVPFHLPEGDRAGARIFMIAQSRMFFNVIIPRTMPDKLMMVKIADVMGSTSTRDCGYF
jgi:uncharacterized membrane protein YwaF